MKQIMFHIQKEKKYNTVLKLKLSQCQNSFR